MPADHETPGCDPHDPYVANAREVARWVERATKRTFRPRARRAELGASPVDLNDLLEIEDSPYAALAGGMTGRPHGEEREKHPLRPAMLRLLARALKEPRESSLVDEVLVALRAAGVEERKWALAITMQLSWGLTHEEIARAMHCDRSTVSRYIGWATEWITNHLAEAGLLEQLGRPPAGER
jgi:DNA-directed RNA polymerase specialized sigma24 family protein